MFDPAEYLKAEFSRYFPTGPIDVQFVGENTVVTINQTARYICEPTSDDDHFIFVCYHGQDPDDAIDPAQVITVPFHPEQLS